MPSNPHPQNVVNRKVTVGTTNGETTISEGHKIFGPYAQDITVTNLSVGSKKVIPLTNNTGQGAHFLKFTFPEASEADAVLDSTIYVTFCKKDSNYTDGYRDYQTSLPQSFIDDLKTWIDNGRSPLQSSGVRYRKLTFTSYGRETLQPENAVTFEIRFSYTGVAIQQSPGSAAEIATNAGGTSTGGGVAGQQSVFQGR